MTQALRMKSSLSSMSDIRYTIEARAYSIAGLAAHNFWVLRDAEGKALGQLHGLATSPDNRIKPIGTLGDRLKFYHFGPRARLFGSSPVRDLNFIKPNQPAKPIFSGSPEEVLGHWDHAVQALPYLNRLNVPYTPFGILGVPPLNSNTAYALLGQLMDIPVHYFSGYWQPGWRNAGRILTASQRESMRYPQDFPDRDSA
jgi:hypothetical protein